MFRIINGHNSSSYFWIMPVKIIDKTTNTDSSDNIDEMRKCEISMKKMMLKCFYIIS